MSSSPAIRPLIIHGRKWSSVDPKEGRRDFELWGNGRNQVAHWKGGLASWDIWFDPHQVERTSFHAGIRNDRPDTWRWYRSIRFPDTRPIVLLEKHPEVPNSEAYPLEFVCDVMRVLPGRLTTSIDFQLALALAQGRRHIILNGVGVKVETPTAIRWCAIHQGIHYWIGQCEARGVRLEFEGPCLYRPAELPYGYGPGRFFFATVQGGMNGNADEHEDRPEGTRKALRRVGRRR